MRLSSRMTQTDSGGHLLLIPARVRRTEAVRQRRGVHPREADVITLKLKLLISGRGTHVYVCSA